MEDVLKKELNTSVLTKVGTGGGGQICTGQGYTIDGDQKIFVKYNSRNDAKRMFEGEAASLEAILATDTVTAPTPIKVVDNPNGGAALVTDYLEMSSSLQIHAAQLGEQLARMHLHNSEVCAQDEKRQSFIHNGGNEKELKGITEFGFHLTTYCGFFPQDNSWTDDWVTFFTRKLGHSLDLVETEYGDREVIHLWSQLQHVIPMMFSGVDIKPALVHADLWSGNVAENSWGPLIFDPTSFYGHSEFEFGNIELFGGFGPDFLDAYRKVLPEVQGYKQRVQLYMLYNAVNHWNHFGLKYRDQTLKLMRQLVE